MSASLGRIWNDLAPAQTPPLFNRSLSRGVGFSEPGHFFFFFFGFTLFLCFFLATFRFTLGLSSLFTLITARNWPCSRDARRVNESFEWPLVVHGVTSTNRSVFNEIGPSMYTYIDIFIPIDTWIYVKKCWYTCEGFVARLLCWKFEKPLSIRVVKYELGDSKVRNSADRYVDNYLDKRFLFEAALVRNWSISIFIRQLSKAECVLNFRRLLHGSWARERIFITTVIPVCFHCVAVGHKTHAPCMYIFVNVLLIASILLSRMAWKRSLEEWAKDCVSVLIAYLSTNKNISRQLMRFKGICVSLCTYGWDQGHHYEPETFHIPSIKSSFLLEHIPQLLSSQILPFKKNELYIKAIYFHAYVVKPIYGTEKNEFSSYSHSSRSSRIWITRTWITDLTGL